MKNTILAATSMLLTWLFLEFVVFQYGLSHLPLGLHGFLEKGLQPLAQSSKAGTVPKDYALMVGDSYAKGYGDWLYSADPNSNPPFHSAHVIQDQTGIDVLNFGLSGAGSTSGLVVEPISHFQFLNSTFRFKLSQPQQVLVYFFEGNDLNNNIARLKLWKDAGLTFSDSMKEEEFENLIYSTQISEHPVFVSAEQMTFFSNFFGTRLSWSLIRTTLPSYGRKVWDDGSINKIFINNSVVTIVDNLQSPALELTPDEIELSLSVFEQSLKVLKNYFGDSEFLVVYIPSPIASYRLASNEVSIETYQPGTDIFPAELVRRNSDLICRGVEAVSGRMSVQFVDSRPAIRRLSSTKLVHGPLDWRHFNKHGYEALGETVSRAMQTVENINCSDGIESVSGNPS